MSQSADKDVSGVPRTLPRGRHNLGSTVVSASQRERIIDAILDVCCEKGYDATSVEDVVKRGGISRKTFYEHFENKEACIVAAYDAKVGVLIRNIAAAVNAADAWQARVRAVSHVYTESLAANPAFAHVFLIDAVGSNPALRRRRDAGFEQFITLYTELTRQAREEWPELPEVSRETIAIAIGAFAELSRFTLIEHGPDALPGISDTLVDIAWTIGKGLESPPEQG